MDGKVLYVIAIFILFDPRSEIVLEIDEDVTDVTDVLDAQLAEQKRY